MLAQGEKELDGSGHVVFVSDGRAKKKQEDVALVAGIDFVEVAPVDVNQSHDPGNEGVQFFRRWRRLEGNEHAAHVAEFGGHRQVEDAWGYEEGQKVLV